MKRWEWYIGDLYMGTVRAKTIFDGSPTRLVFKIGNVETVTMWNNLGPVSAKLVKE